MASNSVNDRCWFFQPLRVYYRGLIFHARLAMLGLSGPLTKSGPLKAEEEGYIASKEEISVEVYYINDGEEEIRRSIDGDVGRQSQCCCTGGKKAKNVLKPIIQVKAM